MTNFILMLAVVLTACALFVNPAPTAIPSFIDDKTVTILLANQEAVALHSTAEAIAEKLFGNGTQ
jgi:hypothetical protein